MRTHLDWVSAALTPTAFLLPQASRAQSLDEGFSAAAHHLTPRRQSALCAALAAANEDSMAVSRAINPVLFTIAGPFHHDPARQFPLFPGLGASAELADLEPTSEEAGFIKTELLRETNRIERALARATCIASRGTDRTPCL